jgi:pyrimidine deaminase RibD-like protein
MNLKELDSFRISDAISFHDKLNPKLWNNNRLRPEVKQQLLIIAEDFLEELGINGLDVEDMTVSGSNAAYSYTPNSDLDLHILVDMSKLPNNEVYRELFTAKKSLYNDSHDIKIHGIPVELYVQDAREPVVSLGEYSLKNDNWIKIPSKRRANFDQTATKTKYEKLLTLIELALKSRKYSKVSNIIKTIKRYRQSGLDKGGEFGPENLAYKALRAQGLITQLYDLRDKLHSEKLTIETMYQPINDDYDPNGIPPGPETKPTMPAGTVRVDVSDVYDWYKLGQNISNLDRVDPKIFGKGPPSTIMSFGSEPEEHNYINQLQNLGLTTTDIDPIDPNQPKGMKRQKVDPTFNVNETSDDEIHNYKKLDKILIKLCDMIVKGKEIDSKYYGMVAAAVIDPDNNIVAGVNRYGSNGKRVHAERVAIEKYESKYGLVPKGSIVVTTLSPCNEHNDETAAGRVGESCTDYLNSKGIEKVYCGYMDPTQDNDQRQFNLMETGNQDIREECKSFADTFLKQDVNEAFDQPYKLKWEKGDHGDIDAIAKMDDGNYLSIMFNKGYNQDKEEAWNIEFFRNNSQEVTGEGDAQRVFATVLTAIQIFIKKYKPNRVIFSASKEVEQGQNAQSRARLYDSLVQRYARAWGFKAFRADTGNKVIYELSRRQPVAEFSTMQYASEKTPAVNPYGGLKDNQYRGGISEASGYIPSEKEKNDPRFKTALTVDVHPDSIKKNAKAFGWLTSRAGIPPTARANGKI